MISTTCRTDSTSSSANVEQSAGRGVGLFEREQQRVRDVLRVAVVVEGETVVGDDDATAAVEHATYHDPFARRELVGPVHVRVSEVRCVGVVFEHRLLGPHDAIALLVFRRVGDGRGVFGGGGGGGGGGAGPRASPPPGSAAPPPPETPRRFSPR